MNVAGDDSAGVGETGAWVTVDFGTIGVVPSGVVVGGETGYWVVSTGGGGGAVSVLVLVSGGDVGA